MNAAQIRRMLEPGAWPFAVDSVRLVETHISWVLLAGEFAFKIKKPLDLGFLDFSTSERRRYFAQEEVRLNRRFAPELYLDVVPVAGPAQAPRIGGDGPPIDVAVRMRRFDDEHQLDRELAAGTLSVVDLEAVGREVARFQAEAPIAGAGDDWGCFARVVSPMRENFGQMRGLAAVIETGAQRLDALEAATERRASGLRERIEGRRRDGFVREGHGDLHLSNLARLAEGIRAFDCIEFDPALRWIDVIDEVAFLFMDLAVRGRDDLGWVFVNAWLTVCGDYAGVGLLRFYALYRTLVRAKVAAIQYEQADGNDERAGLRGRVQRHMALADDLADPGSPRLLLMHGVSGSGKSFLAGRLAAGMGALHLRSDVERKRLYGAGLDAHERTAPGEGIYDARAGERTYARLLDLAAGLIADGERVIVDATFLVAAQRAAFIALAGSREVPVTVFACDAGEAVLRERVNERLARARDPSDADVHVLEDQLRRREWPRAEEGARVVVLQTDVLTAEAAIERARAAG